MSFTMNSFDRRTFVKMLAAMGAASRLHADDQGENWLDRDANELAYEQHLTSLSEKVTIENPFPVHPYLCNLNDETVTLALYSEAPEGTKDFIIEQLNVDINKDKVKFYVDDTRQQKAWDPGIIYLEVPIKKHRNVYNIRWKTDRFYQNGKWHFYSPKKPGESFRVGLIGDTHIFDAPEFFRNLEGFEALRTLIRRRHLDKSLLDYQMTFDMGDSTGIGTSYTYAYEHGLFEKHENKDLAAAAFNVNLRTMLGEIPSIAPMYRVLGNHDGEEGWGNTRDEAVIARKAFSPNRNAVSADENYYSVRQGDTEFFVLDVVCATGKKKDNGGLSKPVHPMHHRLDDEQREWIRTALEESEAKYKIVMAHHVVGGWRYQAGGERPGGYGRGAIADAGWQKRLHEIMLENGVNAFIYGHDHLLTVHKIDGLNYVCTGKPTAVHGVRWMDSKGWNQAYPKKTEVIPPLWVPAYVELNCTPDGIYMNFIRTRHDFKENYALGNPGDTLLSEDFKLA